MTARTIITVDTLQFYIIICLLIWGVMPLLTRTFGGGNVLNIHKVMTEDEEGLSVPFKA